MPRAGVGRHRTLFCTAGRRPAALEAVANGTMDKVDDRIGHSPTDFDRWLNATASYEIDYESGFEPWGILRRCGHVTRCRCMPPTGLLVPCDLEGLPFTSRWQEAQPRQWA